MSASGIPIYRGACHCGSISFILTSLPTSSVHCWCSACRINHAAPFVSWNVFPEESIKWIVVRSGEAQYGEVSALETLVSRQAKCCVRNFCSECATPIFIGDQDEKGIISVPTALLTVDSQLEGKEKEEAEKALKPSKHIWLQDRVFWAEVPDDGLPRYQQYDDAERNKQFE